MKKGKGGGGGGGEGGGLKKGLDWMGEKEQKKPPFLTRSSGLMPLEESKRLFQGNCYLIRLTI